jgi:hypothetical protein
LNTFLGNCINLLKYNNENELTQHTCIKSEYQKSILQNTPKCNPSELEDNNSFKHINYIYTDKKYRSIFDSGINSLYTFSTMDLMSKKNNAFCNLTESNEYSLNDFNNIFKNINKSDIYLSYSNKGKVTRDEIINCMINNDFVNVECFVEFKKDNKSKFIDYLFAGNCKNCTGNASIRKENL